MRNRKKYPRDWRKRVQAAREAAGNKCTVCQVPHGTPRISRWTGRKWPVWLQGAHVNHDPENPSAVIVVVCPYCHWHFYRRHDQVPRWLLEKRKHKELIERAWCQ